MTAVDSRRSLSLAEQPEYVHEATRMASMLRHHCEAHGFLDVWLNGVHVPRDGNAPPDFAGHETLRAYADHLPAPVLRAARAMALADGFVTGDEMVYRDREPCRIAGLCFAPETMIVGPAWTFYVTQAAVALEAGVAA